MNIFKKVVSFFEEHIHRLFKVGSDRKIIKEQKPQALLIRHFFFENWNIKGLRRDHS